MRIALAVAAILSSLCAAPDAQAQIGDFHDALARQRAAYARQARDRFTASQQALDELRTRALQGDTEAQATLGERLLQRAVPSACAEGLDWLGRAGKQGHPGARRTLAVWAYAGEAPPPLPDAATTQALQHGIAAAGRQDFTAAARWFTTAALAGSSIAQFNLGRLHEAGLGVRRDDAAAIEAYRSASRQGMRAAELAWARLQFGIDVKRHRHLRTPWTLAGTGDVARRAACEGNADAFMFLGYMRAGYDNPESWYWFRLGGEAHSDARVRAEAEWFYRLHALTIPEPELAFGRLLFEAWRQDVAARRRGSGDKAEP